MSSRKLLTFFIPKDQWPKTKLAQFGKLYALKTAAMKHNQDTLYILMRKDAHNMTYKTDGHGLKPDVWHITLDLKNDQMIKEGTHQTLHGNLVENTKKKDRQPDNTFYIDNIVPKAKVEPDKYHDKRKNREVDNWDVQANNLIKILEPEELQNVVLGKDWITVLDEYQNMLQKLLVQQKVEFFKKQQIKSLPAPQVLEEEAKKEAAEQVQKEEKDAEQEAQKWIDFVITHPEEL
ncbi:MAG: hypothetical protein Q9163_001662 [Psora crenata]